MEDAKISTDRMFDGGGEMGSLMRSFDWSKTVLGPVSGWSQALKTTIGIVLRSPSPRRVRASPGGDQLYLVALTGYDGSDARAKVKEAGFNLHLAKPVDVSELAKLLSNSRA